MSKVTQSFFLFVFVLVGYSYKSIFLILANCEIRQEKFYRPCSKFTLSRIKIFSHIKKTTIFHLFFVIKISDRSESWIESNG